MIGRKERSEKKTIIKYTNSRKRNIIHILAFEYTYTYVRKYIDSDVGTYHSYSMRCDDNDDWFALHFMYKESETKNVHYIK